MKTQPTFFAFTKVVVNDIEAMTRFYVEVFGMREVQRVAIADMDEVMLSLSADDPHPRSSCTVNRDVGIYAFW